MKLTNEELDAILEKAGLQLDQEYSSNNSYRKDGWLFTKCKTCGTEAHYRLKYILEKNEIGEPVCRMCYWMNWYGENHRVQGEARKNLIKHGHWLEALLGAKEIEENNRDTDWHGAEVFAGVHGFDLIDLVHGPQKGDDIVVVRCRACGRQTVERPCDVEFGCTCSQSKANRGQ